MTVAAFPDIAPATAPPEALGRARSDVALLVATRSDGELEVARFSDLPRLLDAGDLLVVNTSATLAAAVPGQLDGVDVVVHLSTPLDEDRWVVELRTAALAPVAHGRVPAAVELPAGAALELLEPYRGSDRLAEARLELPVGLAAYLARYGSPIRYPGSGRWPLSAYQTVFAREPGSAEMPSAGRPFTSELVTELVSEGVLIAPLVLHAGVSSLERGEAPYPERYRVPAATARVVNAVRDGGGRVIAVGTTVVRALETVADAAGRVHAGEGWTSLVVTPDRGLRAADGLLTGWHEPESSHLLMLEAAAGRELLERSYAAAAAHGFAGHEFGDAHLILP
jgi:S-adenosylmethionine:tRNA ribosyltransferase-isomerase